MLDSFGRNVNYLRLSVTDRCDLRCKYCMPVNQKFYKKVELLSLEQLITISKIFIEFGINKIRITGGEPLIRKDIIKYLEFLCSDKRLKEILITTNGTQLYRLAKIISQFGIKRLNVSLDSLVSEKYNFITNGGSLKKVIDGIRKAQEYGIKIKINTVLLKKFNNDEICQIVEWCSKNNYELTFIEVMPIGDLPTSRTNQYLSVDYAKKKIKEKFGLTGSKYKTNGPSRYFKVDQLQSKVGFISPISNHFCKTCNRVRITSTGKLYPCLGYNNHVDLKNYIETDKISELKDLLRSTIFNKPERHDFKINNHHSELNRHMNTTGG